MNHIYGRNKEIEELNSVFSNPQAKLVALYGRRRVGKTYLVENAFPGDVALLKFEGLEGLPAKEQIRTCYRDLSTFFSSENGAGLALEWEDFFDELHNQLTNFNGKIVVFFDEFQWLAAMRTSLVSKFKKAWDNKFSKLSHCNFIICGSISSFIVKKVVKSKALYGRIDREFNLKPLKVTEVHEFFEANTPKSEILETYFVLGGVPKYYTIFDFKLSLQQNCERFFFRQGGFLFSEKSKLFISHFGSDPVYEKIVNTISKSPQSSTEIARSIKMESGGTLSSKIEDLELSGFICKQPRITSTKRDVKYLISDYYLRFYFAFVQPNLQKINRGQYHFYKDTQLNLKIWYGRSFEHLLLSNFKAVSDRLSFSSVEYVAGAWHPKEGKGQIDLAFLRDDRTLTICELKYRPTLSTQTIVNQFREKEDAVSNAFPRHRIHRVFISGHPLTERKTGELKQYFHDVVTAEEIF